MCVARSPDPHGIPKHWRWFVAGCLFAIVLFAALLMAVAHDCGNRPITLRCFATR